MASRSGTIDLGESAHGTEPELEVRWLVRERLRRHWRRLPARRMVGAAVAAGLTLATMASATSNGPSLVPHFTVRAGVYEVDGETLYTLDRPDEDGTEVTLTARRLADAGIRWQASLPGRLGNSLVARTGVLLAVSSLDSSQTTTAFDTDSGRRLWTRAGRADFVGESVMVTEVSGGSGEAALHRLVMVDPATGDPQRRFTVAGWNYAWSAASGYLLALEPSGQLTSYHLGTGEPAATTSTEWPPEAKLQLAGSLALVAAWRGSEQILTAYDTATLARRWTTVAQEGSLVENAWSLPQPCGELICLGSGQPLRALDPVTGETVWSADWLPPDSGPASGDPGSYSLLGLGAGPLAGHLVVSVPSDRPEPTLWLADARTGAPVLELGDWVLPQLSLAPFAPELSTLTRRGDDGAIWLGRLRPDLSGVAPLAVVRTAVPVATCKDHGRYVACASPAGSRPGEVELWRFRR